jgi:hypothetical protein
MPGVVAPRADAAVWQVLQQLQDTRRVVLPDTSILSMIEPCLMRSLFC